jgi:DNA-binding PadR family transcriptional regulator
MRAVNREILLSFWKLHILHHAAEEAVNGQWILMELRRHGYDISPGTLYPMLSRMEKLGWLKGKPFSLGGRRTRRDYRLTAKGQQVLEFMRGKIRELYEEIVEGG